MNLTPTGFLIVVLILCVVALIVVTAEILYDRDEPEPAPEPVRDVCDLENCDGRATVIYDAHPSGGVLYICDYHAAVVREWVGRSLTYGSLSIEPTAPFDQEAS
jgi:hypothetical protein